MDFHARICLQTVGFGGIDRQASQAGFAKDG
jgi:hypothetical protein